MNFGILGSGSWGTALAKILTDGGQTIYWYNRSQTAIDHIKTRNHNPQYLPTALFNISKLKLTTSPEQVIKNSDCILIAVPSAYADDVLSPLPKDIFVGKKIISAIKGILPQSNLLLNDYLKQHFKVPIENYVAVLGPCHAEEVAAEQLSYLTFSGLDEITTTIIARYFKSEYINTIVNKDVIGVQYAGVAKNIYALGAGIAHGLEYGDNFLSVFIANCANEMQVLLKEIAKKQLNDASNMNHNASVYLGDLLVTCYSLHSRNRTFGNMIGKGYSVRAAELELNMVAEGYNASKCIHTMNQTLKVELPIMDAVYQILWEGAAPDLTFKNLEQILV